MSEDCPFCLYEKTEENCPGCFEGSNYRPKPMTNADRIRQMTDEKLAEWLGKETIFCCDRGRVCNDEPCEPCLLRWLKSPEVDNGREVH